MLDPEREYGMPGGGALTYEEVVAGVRSGKFLIEPGQNLPVLWEAFHHWALKGTGIAVRQSSGPQQAALAEFRRMALDDVPFAYQNLVRGMKRGDPRYDKIFWENLLGKMGENRGGDAVAEAFKAVVEALRSPETRSVMMDAEFVQRD